MDKKSPLINRGLRLLTNLKKNADDPLSFWGEG